MTRVNGRDNTGGMTKQEMARYRRRKAKILRLIAKGVSQAEIARQLGVKRQRINQIVNGR